MANLPGRSGLGSSSSFTVGMINALNEFFDRTMSQDELANTAIEIERTILKESGGFQDQFQATFGGLRHYEFRKDKVSVSEELGNGEFRETLNQSMVLLPLLQSRNSDEFAKNTEIQISSNNGFKLVEKLSSLASETRKKINESKSPLQGLNALAQAMSEGWEIKRKLSANVETDRRVDSIIEFGLSGGALSGRLCGAGGTGF
jgi:D-glycero-alpha-D-manno-heptose-7-phosphate kinase